MQVLPAHPESKKRQTIDNNDLQNLISLTNPNIRNETPAFWSAKETIKNQESQAESIAMESASQVLGGLPPRHHAESNVGSHHHTFRPTSHAASHQHFEFEMLAQQVYQL